MGKIMEKIIGVRADKKEYREQMARAKRLPHTYREMFDNIKKYIWSVGPLDGGLDILYGVIELFEQSAADGQKVREVTGED
ncbi:MAG: DUF1048 domain-containing protein, partial [Candidatus Nomurabacteria bacterium]|nr:DUF1048 domain-containing protein [Candidatus Nomurabacteria bacterium]